MSTEPTPPISTSSTPASVPVPGTSSLQQQQVPPPNNNSGNWKLPIGIEDHIEDGVIKITAGVVIGGALGMLMFKSGKGWRSACIASGLGVALGSTYVRFISSTTSNRSSTGANNSSGSNNSSTSSNTTVSSNAITPVARLQPFDTKPVPAIGKDVSQS